MRVPFLSVLAVAIGCGSGTHALNDAPLAIDAPILDSGNQDAKQDASPAGYVVARSGSRLKISWYQTADGVRAPIEGFFDSALGMSCAPRPWTDSVTRCTP